jgi:hypothetical protein
MANTNENGLDGVPRAEDEADLFVAVHQRGRGAGLRGGVSKRSDEPAFADAYAGTVERDGEMGGNATAARMGDALAVEADDAPFVLELSHGFENRRAFAKAQECGDVRKFNRTRGVGNFDDSLFDAIVNDSGGQDGFFIFRERGIGAGDESRKRIEGLDKDFGAEGELGLFPACDEFGPVGIGVAAKHGFDTLSEGGYRPIVGISHITMMNATQTKTTDVKGRVALGSHVANRLVSVTKVTDSEYVIKLVRAIPEDEAWLYDNPKALEAVRTGLKQARKGQVKKGPNLATDKRLLDQIEG